MIIMFCTKHSEYGLIFFISKKSFGKSEINSQFQYCFCFFFFFKYNFIMIMKRKILNYKIKKFIMLKDKK